MRVVKRMLFVRSIKKVAAIGGKARQDGTERDGWDGSEACFGRVGGAKAFARHAPKAQRHRDSLGKGRCGGLPRRGQKQPNTKNRR